MKKCFYLSASKIKCQRRERKELDLNFTGSDDGKSKSSQLKVHKSFEDRIDEPRDYKSEYGNFKNCKVPSKFESNPTLASWCNSLFNTIVQNDAKRREANIEIDRGEH